MDLAPTLPKDRRYSALHLRTNAYQCKPLVISRKKPLTLKIKHLLLLSETASSRIILGIEIYVYLTFHGPVLERHIFISKADTTGLGSHKISVAGITKSFLQYVIGLDPKVYLDGATYRKRNESGRSGPSTDIVSDSSCDVQIANELRALGRRLRQNPSMLSTFLRDKATSEGGQPSELPVEMPSTLKTQLSLFTRSADAYLFPQSEKNKGKHVADGNTLFKWWIAILADILDDAWSCKADIPGSDSRSVGKFIPLRHNWSIGNIYVSSESSSKAVHTIPLFPDDPKGRFLEHLIVEGRHKAVDTRQFWDELGFRQEFRLGNVVGIIGCSKDSDNINGASECQQTSIFSPRQYKKIRELIKGEDYRNGDAVSDLWLSGLSELATGLGAKLHYLSITGTSITKTSTGSSDIHTSNVPPVITTLGVKRKPLPVNNLSGLVKRKKK